MDEESDPDLRHFRRDIRLRDGTPAVLRAIAPDDGERIVAAFGRLEPSSIYSRFFSYRKELGTADLARVQQADFVNAVVLVVALGSGAEQVLIGGASCFVRTADDGRRIAEVSFTIEEDYHGQGLASRLLAELVRIARARGIARFEAEVLATNAPMRAVFARSGLPMTERLDDGVVHVELDLAAV